MSTYNTSPALFGTQADQFMTEVMNSEDYIPQPFVTDDLSTPNIHTFITHENTTNLITVDMQSTTAADTLRNHIMTLKFKLSTCADTLNSCLIPVQHILKALDDTGRKVTRSDKHAFRLYAKAFDVYFNETEVAIDEFRVLADTFLQGKGEEYLPTDIQIIKAEIGRFLTGANSQMEAVNNSIRKYDPSTTEVKTPVEKTTPNDGVTKKKRGRPATGSLKDNHAKLVKEHEELKMRFKATRRELETTKTEVMKWKKEAETSRKSLDFTMAMQEKLESTRAELRLSLIHI